MAKYVIKREDLPGHWLEGCGIGCNVNLYTYSTEWTAQQKRAIQFENQKAAQATIDFITNVIDWEQGKQLYIEEVQENGQG